MFVCIITLKEFERTKNGISLLKLFEYFPFVLTFWPFKNSCKHFIMYCLKNEACRVSLEEHILISTYLSICLFFGNLSVREDPAQFTIQLAFAIMMISYYLAMKKLCNNHTEFNNN